MAREKNAPWSSFAPVNSIRIDDLQGGESSDGEGEGDEDSDPGEGSGKMDANTY